MSVKLQLTQAFTTQQTPGGDDLSAAIVSENGKYAVVSVTSFNSLFGDLPEYVFSIYRVVDYKIQYDRPLYSFPYSTLTSTNRYVLSVTFSPDLKKFLIATAPIQTPIPSSPATAGTTDNSVIYQYTGSTPSTYVVNAGPNGNYTFDVTLSLYAFTSDFSGVTTPISRVFPSIYLGTLIFFITWYQDPRYFTLKYVLGLTPTNTEPSTIVYEVIDSINLNTVATQQTLVNSSTQILFRLKDDDSLYLTYSGCATNLNINSLAVVGVSVLEYISPPSYIGVFRVNFVGGTIDLLDTVLISGSVRNIDVKVCRDEALIVSAGRYPVQPNVPVPYTLVVQTTATPQPPPQYPTGVQTAFIQDGFTDSSTVQLVRFRDDKLTVAERLSTHKPEEGCAIFIPGSDVVILGTEFPVDSYVDGVLFRISKKRECCHYLHPYDTYNPFPVLASLSVSFYKDNQVVVSGGVSADNDNTNTGIGVNNVVVYKVEHIECSERV